MASVIIFGGSGFVGTHLVRHLLDRGDRVTIADIRSPGWHAPSGISPPPKVGHVVCDVRHPIDDTLMEGDIDCIVNLAAVHTTPGHPAHEYFQTNILGARHITDFAQRRGVPRIVFTSSISVYGPGEDEKTENPSPCPPYHTGRRRSLPNTFTGNG